MTNLNLKNNTLISLLFASFLITSVNVEHGMSISEILIYTYGGQTQWEELEWTVSKLQIK